MIENFRSIKKCTVEIGDLVALVGENSSGKTTVLRALNSFFNFDIEKDGFENETHRYSNTSTVTRIEIRFTDIPDDPFFDDKKINNELIIRMKYSYSRRRRTLEYKNQNGYSTLSLEAFKNVLKHIQFVYIPNNRDYTQMQWSENGLLQRVVKAYLQRHTSARDTLSPMVRKAARNFERLGLNRIVSEIEKYYALNRDFAFNIGFSAAVDYSLLLNDIALKIDDSGNLFNIADTGSGIQSLTTIALYRYLAHLQHTNYILGMEEPETNLHPQAQRELINAFKSNPNNSREVQIIFTTHSSVILDEMDHDEIVLFRRVKDQNRQFRTTSRQLPKNFWDRYQLEEFKYYQFYRYKNSEFFFSRFVVVVESKNDAQVVKELLRQQSIDPDLQGVSFLSLDGVKNLKYPLFLLKELSIPHFIIVDKDFFLPYINGELNNSRDGSGFPKYKNEYKSANNYLINEMITNSTDRNLLLQHFKSNHSRALDLLVKYNIISMKYTTEIDLIASHTATSHYYSILNVPLNEQSPKELLTKRAKQIKRVDNLLEVIRRTPHKNLPNSYKRIKRVLGEKIKNLTSISENIPDR